MVVAHINLLRKEYCTKVQYNAQDTWRLVQYVLPLKSSDSMTAVAIPNVQQSAVWLSAVPGGFNRSTQRIG